MRVNPLCRVPGIQTSLATAIPEFPLVGEGGGKGRGRGSGRRLNALLLS